MEKRKLYIYLSLTESYIYLRTTNMVLYCKTYSYTVSIVAERDHKFVLNHRCYKPNMSSNSINFGPLSTGGSHLSQIFWEHEHLSG